MPRAEPGPHAAGVPDDQHPDEMAAATLSAFVVELRAAGGSSSDIRAMHNALMFAVSRLRVAGVAIAAGRSVLLPRDSRCLCLLLTGDQEAAVLARDTAGLSAAPIHPAVLLPHGGDSDGWSRPAEPDTRALGGTS